MAKRKKRIGMHKTTARRKKALRKPGVQRATPKKAKAKKTRKGMAAERRSAVSATTPARRRRGSPTPAPEAPIESTVIDIVEEPAPGVIVISEFEAVRVALPDSDDESKG